MKLRTLILRSLRFHWRSHLGVVIGAAIGSAALIGALIVGDSVRGSLRARALERIGHVQLVLTVGDGTFRSELARDLSKWTVSLSNELGLLGVPGTNLPVVPCLMLRGTASTPDGAARANQVQVLGVEGQFWRLALQPPRFLAVTNGGVVLNDNLAAQLRVAAGDEVLLRVAMPGGMSGEIPVAPGSGRAAALRLRVQSIVTAAGHGDFALRAGSAPPLNAFVSLRELQRHTLETNRANLLLAPVVQRPVRRHGFPLRDLVRALLWQQVSVEWAKRMSLYRAETVTSGDAYATLASLLRKELQLADAGLQLNSLGHPAAVELTARNIFIPQPVEDRVLGHRDVPDGRIENDWFVRRPDVATNAQPILTYLANLITAGTNATPYSMITAAGAPWTPADLRDDEIILNQWLADDLHAKPGDELLLAYFEPESGARLRDRTNSFRVHSIVPMQMPWADRTLMPQFPGIEKAETTAEWDTAFPLVHKIRPQDDAYWHDHRGTPKAFITLAAGRKMWASRFGNLTAIRFPIPTNLVAAGRMPGATIEAFRAALEKKILATLKPEELGLRFEPAREQALKAAGQSQDFGGLFIGFSLFVIVAALLLMALLFQFSLEQRATEIGTLLALGFAPRHVRRLFLREGAALAFIGGILGTLGGIGYAKAMLLGLSTIWRDAVGANTLKFFVTPQTLAIGLFASTLVAVFTLWLTMRKHAKQPARALLTGGDGGLRREGGGAKPSRAVAVGAAALIAAMGLIGWTLAKGDTASAGAYFGAGALVLAAGVSLLNTSLACHSKPSSILHLPSSQSLAVRGLGRRRSRSVATVAILACGSFLIVSIGVFRLDASHDTARRASGTGGFALIGESTLHVVADLNTKTGRESFALNEADFAGVHFVQFRVRDGDEASCLNLNRAAKPRLLGANPEALEGRFTFTAGAGWQSLKTTIRNPQSAIEVPAIGDAASIQWAMGKKVDDTLDYVDGRGQPFKVRIVGAVANSILQGQLIIDEAEFVKRFPGESGYKFFLIDAPTNRVADVSATLSRALQDAGLQLTPAPQRSAQFNAVQNTYLGTFQLLGGLGLLLGSAGLGIVVLRNTLERRGELAVLLAVGWRRGAVSRLVLVEHVALLALGLALGILAAAVAVLPSVLTPGAGFPWLSLGLTLGGVLANGILWTWLAVRLAVRGDLLAALRNE